MQIGVRKQMHNQKKAALVLQSAVSISNTAHVKAHLLVTVCAEIKMRVLHSHLD